MQTGLSAITRFPVHLAAILLSLLLAACQQESGKVPGRDSVDKELAITGQLIYLQRIALPPNAVVTIQLRDVSLADAPAKVVAEEIQKLEDQQIPIPFTLKAPSDDLQPRNRYAVAARIEDGDGKLLWVTDTHIAVEPALTGTLELGDVRLAPARVSE